jgi:hypothetical protein
VNTKRQGTSSVELDDKKYTAKQRVRIERLIRELRITDQIISPDLDSVNVAQHGPAAAWTTLQGDAISFNMSKMPFPETRFDVAVWIGTNAHELGHVLYTPRTESTLIRRALEAEKIFMRGIMKLHNIVEDQRQERLILSQFAPWTGSLVAALHAHVVSDSESAWILLCGRTWIARSVRAAARASFVAARSDAIADQVAQLVGDYQRLTDPGESEVDEAWRVLTELHDLFADALPTMPEPCNIPRDGEPDTDTDAGTDIPTADEDDPNAQDDDDSDDDSAAADGEPCDDGEPGRSDASDDDASGDGDGDGDDDDGDDDASGDGDGDDDDGDDDDGDDDSTTSTSRGNRRGKPRPPKDIKDQLRDAAQDALNENDASSDLDDVLDALDYGRPGDPISADETPGTWTEADDEARRLHHSTGDALLDLKDESEPAWIRRVDSGRLNAARVMNPAADLDSMFDRYEPGQMDATDMEVVLLLDVSGSMDTHCEALARAAWAIRRAVDDIEGTCTVITWDSGPHRLLAGPDERPDNRMLVPDACDGTDPKSALTETYRILANSQSPIRIMLILTDGDWSDAPASETIIRQMNQAGITTALAYLPPPANAWFAANSKGMQSHECQTARDIADPAGLAALFRDIAARRIATQWTR